MSSVLFLGFLIGMHHALEADHVAAVASIAARQTSRRRIVTHGAVWGLGHTLTLMAVAGGSIVLGGAVDGGLAAWLELGVGVMLVALGGNLLYRLYRERVHFHVHDHAGGDRHLHAHSHRRASPAGGAGGAHDHNHPPGLPVRTFLVGIVHGMAGSAALLVLTVSVASDPVFGFVYVGLFGLGSIAGMVLLSAVMAVPLAWTARSLTWASRAAQVGIGAGTVILGILAIGEFSLA